MARAENKNSVKNSSETNISNRLPLVTYLVTIYFLTYMVTVVLSGIHVSSAYEPSFVSSWPRGILMGIALVWYLWYLSLAWHKDSDTLDILASPITLHTLGTLTFVVSVIASVFSTHFMRAFQQWAFRGQNSSDLLIPFGNIVIVFIAGIITMLVLFIQHGRQAHRLKIALESEQKEQSKELRNAIRVAPPPYFTKMLADVTDQSEDFQSEVTNDYAAFEALLSDSTVSKEEKIEKATSLFERQRVALRAVLTGFGRLARTYDNVNPLDKNSDIEYRANLMLNLEYEGEGLEVLFPEGMPVERFTSPFHARPKYCLVIDKRLSVRISKRNDDLFKSSNGKNDEEIISPNDFKSDSKVKDALLPVYWDEGNDDLLNYNMIGAPTAIVKGEAQFIPDTIKEIDQATQYSKEIQQKAREYFHNDTKGRSIVSFPVATRHFRTKLSPSATPKLFFGAINLYRNEKDIFSGDISNFKFFSDFTRPLHLILGRMCQFHIATCFHIHALRDSEQESQ